MAGISFNNYLVHELHFENNMEFYNNANDKTDETLTINPSYNSIVTMKGDNATVSLTISVDMEDDTENTPFSLFLTLVGFFEYNQEESDDIEFKDFLTESAIAILFPYLRATVSDVTGNSNVYPSLRLPVMNISRMLKENDLIEVEEIDESE